MGKVKELTDIHIYKLSLNLAQEAYKLTVIQQLKHEYSLNDQLKRAALSVAANIAEGYGRNTQKDFAQFLSISLGSVNELNTYLDFIKLYFHIDTGELREKYRQLAKQIYAFRKYLLNTHRPLTTDH